MWFHLQDYFSLFLRFHGPQLPSFSLPGTSTHAAFESGRFCCFVSTRFLLTTTKVHWSGRRTGTRLVCECLGGQLMGCRPTTAMAVAAPPFAKDRFLENLDGAFKVRSSMDSV
jgi:hypothetical protein